MAGRYTDEERLARGQYQDASGQWYTKSGYAVTEGGQNVRSEPTGRTGISVRTAEQTAPAAQTAQMAAATPTMQGDYSAYTTNPYAQEAFDAQKNAIANALRQYELQQEKVAEQNRIDKKAAEAARQAALRQSLLRYGASKEQANQDAEAAARQAYISRMLQERDLAQQLSANGYSGGMTDSAYLRLLSNYENSRNAIMTDRDRQLAALQLAIDTEQAQADADIAKANAEYDRAYNDALADIAIARARTQYEGDQALAKLYAQMRDSASAGSSSGSGTGSAKRTSATVKDAASTPYADEAIKDAMKLMLENRTAALDYINTNASGSAEKEALIAQLKKDKIISAAMADWLTRQAGRYAETPLSGNYAITTDKNGNPLTIDPGYSQRSAPAVPGSYQLSETEARNLVMRSASTPVGQLEFLERMVNNGMISREIGERLALYINR